MSSEQIKNGLKLQRIKNFDRLDIYETVAHYDRCCSADLKDEGVELLDTCFYYDFLSLL